MTATVGNPIHSNPIHCNIRSSIWRYPLSCYCRRHRCCCCCRCCYSYHTGVYIYSFIRSFLNGRSGQRSRLTWAPIYRFGNKRAGRSWWCSRQRSLRKGYRNDQKGLYRSLASWLKLILHSGFSRLSYLFRSICSLFLQCIPPFDEHVANAFTLSLPVPPKTKREKRGKQKTTAKSKTTPPITPSHLLTL